MAKILLVEDDNNLREIYEARLRAEGYDIITAQDGEAALAVAVKEKPDLIISDVMMPKISGFDMLDILRGTPETKNAKVIMMTALSQAEDKARADKLGADRYLVKSQVTLEDVAKVAKEVLESDGAPGSSSMPPTVDPVTPATPAAPEVAVATPPVAPLPETPVAQPVAAPEPVQAPMADPASTTQISVPAVSVAPAPEPTAATTPVVDTPVVAMPAATTVTPSTTEPVQAPTVLPSLAPADPGLSPTTPVVDTTAAEPTEPVAELTEDGALAVPGLPPLYDNQPENMPAAPTPHPLELNTQSALPNTPQANDNAPSGQAGAPFLVSQPAPSMPDGPATPPPDVDESAKIAASIESFLATKADASPASTPVPAPSPETAPAAETPVPETVGAAPTPEPTAPVEQATPPGPEASTPDPVDSAASETSESTDKQPKSGYKVIQPISDMSKPPVDLEAMAQREEELGSAQQILNTPVTKPGDSELEQPTPPPHQAGQTIDPTTLAL